MKRILFLRISLPFLSFAAQIYLINLIRSDPGDDLFFGEVIAIFILIYQSVLFVLGIRNYIRVWKSQEQALQKVAVLKGDLGQLNEKARLVDSEIRKQVGVWLHGSVQAKLIKIARELRVRNLSDVADELDNFSESEIRRYAHQLFPPALNISLEAGLVDLIGTNVELVLDEKLSENGSIQDRLILPSDLAYAIYRVIEEGMFNANKKPDVTRIKVTVEVEGKAIQITVEDNGSKLSGPVTAGLGLTLFDIYSTDFDGQFSLENTRDGVAMRMALMFEPVGALDAFAQETGERLFGVRGE